MNWRSIVSKFKVGDESVYVKFSGWYASYDGSNYDEYSFVTPQQKLITVYE
jgi:hypothetical protein